MGPALTRLRNGVTVLRTRRGPLDDTAWPDETGQVASAVADDMSLTMATRIERAIRNDIIAGTLASGERLRIAELSARYGASHIPVREALRQLEGERLVVIESHKGALVRRVDRKFVIDVHDTREAIETMLVRNAARNAGPAEIARLRRCAEVYEQAAAAHNQARMATANHRFHACIADVADNAEAAQILDRGWELVIGLSNQFGRTPGRVATIIDEHRRIAEAIATGDPARAEAAARDHCESAKQDLLKRMDEAGAR